MASFEKKLQTFLESAVTHKVVDQATAGKLSTFLQSGDYEHKGWFSLSTAMGGLGALVLSFGVVLIIATNWGRIDDLTKIVTFLAMLAGSHVLGLYLAHKGYDKTAAGAHLLGAGLFIAGVGLIAQIFNLHSSKGEMYLVWALMITPLAVVLQNGPIALLSVVAFSIWGNVHIDHYLGYKHWMIASAFNASVCLAMVFGGMLLQRKQNPIAPFLQVPGMIGAVIWLYYFGFTHDMGAYSFSETGNILMPFTVLLAALVMAGALWRNSVGREVRQFLMTLFAAASTLLLLLTTIYLGVDKEAYLEHFAFGWTKKIYILPLLVSVSAWVAYFALTFWGVIYGALHHRRWVLNTNVILLGIGIFTRFIDLIGSMFNTGLAFIVFGLALVGIGFILEKWRRKLISRAGGRV